MSLFDEPDTRRMLPCEHCAYLEARVKELEAKITEIVGAPNSGVDTSRAAAEQIKPHMTQQRYRLLHALIRGEAAAQHLAKSTGLSDNSVRPRLRELTALGWVAKTDRTVVLSTGREAHLYRVTMAGRIMWRGETRRRVKELEAKV
jgi:hypothetical protein